MSTCTIKLNDFQLKGNKHHLSARQRITRNLLVLEVVPCLRKEQEKISANTFKRNMSEHPEIFTGTLRPFEFTRPALFARSMNLGVAALIEFGPSIEWSWREQFGLLSWLHVYGDGWSQSSSRPPKTRRFSGIRARLFHVLLGSDTHKCVSLVHYGFLILRCPWARLIVRHWDMREWTILLLNILGV